MTPARIEPLCFDDARRLEWLETNGLGGFAASTLAGMNTRRYHGLLTAATQPPVGRYLLLSKLEETVVTPAGERHELATNQYPGVIHPAGHRFLTAFRRDPFPTVCFAAGGVAIEKQVFMPHGENTVVVEYTAGSACELELRPLVAFRGFHSTTHRNGDLDATVDYAPGAASLQPYAGLPRLYLAHNAGEVEAAGDWFLQFEFDWERRRGLDFQEDLFQPFLLRFRLAAGGRATVIASLDPHRTAADAAGLAARERARREALLAASAPAATPLVRALTAAADQFIVQRGEGKTVVAGYPWFSDWGRDTMIALPGLTLSTGRYDVARDILSAFARSVDQGMLPNRFPDAGEAPEYNTVDASLWYFEAVRAYLQHTADFAFVRAHLLPVLEQILSFHLRGTRYGIAVDERDGLLQCGEPGVQLTWMDAKIGDWVVTPRTGKPVEIQALWYNALCVMAELRRLAGDAPAAADALERAARARDSFQLRFWNPARGCLYDVIGPDGAADAAVRPNQIFAVSLHHAILDGDAARAVVETVERELLTPSGLRSLSPRDSAYRGRYEGVVWERDSAYHQGTVWQWLMGPFITAYLRTHTGADASGARARAAAWVRGFEPQLHAACLGQLSEIADGEPPHLPRGCFAQAWSVAELLRVAIDLG